jgi:hypothetical protein
LAKVEETPEVKRAGGIFYTPQFIVKYIVKNTVGAFSKNSTPNKVSKLRILDPACGSGSFLLGAYTYLLKWHLDYYLKLKNKNKENIYESKNGEWHLTIQEKKRILQQNIYGVDIDPQAVEVTKLSLLLKVLEGENKDAMSAQQKLIKEKALPDLDDNIKCGNSVISSEIYNNKEIKLSTEDRRKMNVFDWNDEFKEIMTNGGFDVVIGNPPYVRQERIKEIKPYLKDHYETYSGVADLYVYFFEKGLKLLSEGGIFSFICSKQFIRANYGANLRKYILKHDLMKYIDYTESNVFSDAKVDPCVTVIKNTTPKPKGNVIVNDDFEIPQNKFDNRNWNFDRPEIMNLKNKIESIGIKIKDIAGINIYRGILTGFNEAFIVDEKKKNELIKANPKSNDIIKPFISGKEIQRWEINSNNLYLIWTYIGLPIKNYPAIKEHLDKYEKKLKKRKDQGKYWWELRACSYYSELEKPKLIYPEIKPYLLAVPDNDHYFINKTCFMIISEKVNLNYLSALMSSKLLNFIFKLIANPIARTSSGSNEKVRYGLSKIFVEQLPIYLASPKKQAPIIDLSEQMLQLHEESKNARTPQDKKLIQRQIDITDKQIDNLVYELYNLTDEEIKIIESN